MDVEMVVARTEAPPERPTETLDVRSQGPPEPLRQTLETLPELSDEVVLVQYNDRVPQHLFPKLDDRGYEYDSVEEDGVIATAIWNP